MAADQTGGFVMRSSRSVASRGLIHIGRQIEELEKAVVENPGLAFDLSKNLIEGVCKRILQDRAVQFSNDDALPKLFKEVGKNIPFLPKTASSESGVRQSLDKTLSGLHTALQGVTELRNQCGFASHGHDEPPPAMEKTQAMLAAQAADAIIGFLYEVHVDDLESPPVPQIFFEDNQAFNDQIDEECGPFSVRDVEMRASEALYFVEPETYRIYLAEFAAIDGAAL